MAKPSFYEAYQFLIFRPLNDVLPILHDEDPPTRNNRTTMEFDIHDIPASFSKPCLSNFVGELRGRELAARDICEFGVNFGTKCWH
jgi:hypothetical protein